MSKALTSFFRERLPERFGVTSGEVVDLNGQTGPRLDILIYDRYGDFTFNSGNQSILAAEALFASVEIKSRLNAGEVRKCVEASSQASTIETYDRELWRPETSRSTRTVKSEPKLYALRFRLRH